MFFEFIIAIIDVDVHEMLVIIMVSLGTWSGHGISMLVSRYKNKGLVNSWFFQV